MGGVWWVVGGLVVDKTKIMLSHLQTEVGVEFEAELGNIGCFGAGLTIASL